MIQLSLLLNVVVLAPVCLGLIRQAAWAKAAYGEAAPARGILLSVYLAIFAVSLLLLAKPDVRMSAALLLVQVIYKVTTPFTVGRVANPVVMSNLVIAAVHLVTLVLIFQAR